MPHSGTDSSNKIHYFLLVSLFIIALGVRLIYLKELQNNPLFDFFPSSLDHFNFDESAQNFANGDLLARSVNNSFSPLYIIINYSFVDINIPASSYLHKFVECSTLFKCTSD